MDAVATAMMGFDVNKIKLISNGFLINELPLANFGVEDISIEGNIGVNTIKDIYKTKSYFNFEPSVGYKGHIEYRNDSSVDLHRTVAV